MSSEIKIAVANAMRCEQEYNEAQTKLRLEISDFDEGNTSPQSWHHYRRAERFAAEQLERAHAAVRAAIQDESLMPEWMDKTPYQPEK